MFVLVADVDVVDVDGVLAFDVPAAHLVFACECHGARTDGVAGVVVAVVAEMLEGEVLHADVGVHRADVGEGALVLDGNASAVGECRRHVHGARGVEVDVRAVYGNAAHGVVERLLDGVVVGAHGGVLHTASLLIIALSGLDFSSVLRFILSR